MKFNSNLIQLFKTYKSTALFSTDNNYTRVVNIILDESTVTLAMEEWAKLARQLELPGDKIKRYRTDLIRNQEDHHTIFIDMLTAWRMQTGAAATMGSLIESLTEIKWHGVAGNRNFVAYPIIKILGNCG